MTTTFRERYKRLDPSLKGEITRVARESSQAREDTGPLLEVLSRA
jgi:hypothetical protein